MKRLVGILVFLLSPVVLIADECKSWGCISTLSEVYVTALSDIRIATPLDETLANCAPVSDKYFTIKQGAPNYEAMYSTVLAAYMADKKIQLRVKEGSSDCELSYIRLYTGF